MFEIWKYAFLLASKFTFLKPKLSYKGQKSNLQLYQVYRAKGEIYATPVIHAVKGLTFLKIKTVTIIP